MNKHFSITLKTFPVTFVTKITASSVERLSSELAGERHFDLTDMIFK
jgi:hypothetical protein